MSLKSVLRAAAGSFVELPADAPSIKTEGPPDLEELLSVLPGRTESKSVMQIAEQTPGPNLDEISVTANGVPHNGMVDFLMVYKSAGIEPISYTAEQMLEMLASLPKELPMATKRQTVEAFISSMGKSLGATPETIIADASRKVVALAAYDDSCEETTRVAYDKSMANIASLEAKIEKERQAIQDAQNQQAQVTSSCDAEVIRLETVTTFFGAPNPLIPVAPPAPSVEEVHPAENIMDRLRSFAGN